MTHIFEFEHKNHLDTPERRKILPPEPILRKLGLTEGMTMIDVGCGTGYFSFPAAEIVRPRGFVWGVDIERRFIEENERRAESLGMENIRFLTGERTVVPLKDAAADAVLASIMFHELEDEDKEIFLRETGRLLRSEGELWILEWKKDEAVAGPPFQERLGPDDIRRFADRAGLAVKKVEDMSPSHYAVILGK